jgi:hypothetical protein
MVTLIAMAATGTVRADAGAEEKAGDETQQAANAPPVKPKAFSGDGFAIAAPENWQTFAQIRPPMLLYLVGDARLGVPPFDGTLSVIKAGLLVEAFPPGARSLKEHIDRDVK